MIQGLLGSDKFINDMQCKIDPDQSLKDIPNPHKNRPIKPLNYYKERYPQRNRAMAEAYHSGHYTLTEIDDKFVISYTTVSSALKEYESGNDKCKA